MFPFSLPINFGIFSFVAFNIKVTKSRLGHVMFDKKPHADIKVSRDWFDGKDCLCVHLYSKYNEDVVLPVTVKFGEFKVNFHPDVFVAGQDMGTGRGVCEWNQVKRNIIDLNISVFKERTNGATLKCVGASNNVTKITIKKLKELTAVEENGVQIAHLPGLWDILLHTDDRGQLMVRLGCRQLPANAQSVKVQIKGKITKGNQTYNDEDVQVYTTTADTNDMIFNGFLISAYNSVVVELQTNVIP